MPVAIHSHITWSGHAVTTIAINQSPTGKPLNGWPGTKLIQLQEDDAKQLHALLGRALATPPQCIDCGSELHTVDDPRCPVANAGERDE